jgi:hypothetical protein
MTPDGRNPDACDLAPQAPAVAAVLRPALAAPEGPAELPAPLPDLSLHLLHSTWLC